MLGIRKWTVMDLYNIGIRFETATLYEAFLKKVQEEYETRVRDAIVQELSVEDLKNFELCESDDEAKAWLEDHLPGYQEFLDEIGQQLNNDLYADRKNIPCWVENPHGPDKRIYSIIESLRIRTFPTMEEGYSIAEIDEFIEKIANDLEELVRITDFVNLYYENFVRRIEASTFNYQKDGYDCMAVDDYLDTVCYSLNTLTKSTFFIDIPDDTLEKMVNQINSYVFIRTSDPREKNITII